MKNKLFIFLILITLWGCQTHLTYPLIVAEVTTDFPQCANAQGSKYRVKIMGNHEQNDFIYTNIKFNVGDTIK